MHIHSHEKKMIARLTARIWHKTLWVIINFSELIAFNCRVIRTKISKPSP